MHGIGYADDDEASTSKANGTNYFVQNSVFTNHVVHVVNTAAKKKNVLRPERIPTCHHCGIKRHIRPNCNKLRKLSNQKQWKTKRKSHIWKTKLYESRKKTFHLYWYTLCWNVWICKCAYQSFITPNLQDQSPTPVLIWRSYWGGVNIEGELQNLNWQKLLENNCLSIMDKKGKNNEARGRKQAKIYMSWIFCCAKNLMYFGFFLWVNHLYFPREFCPWIAKWGRLLIFLCWLIHELDKTLGLLSCIFYFILEMIVVVSPKELKRSPGDCQAQSIGASVRSIGPKQCPSYMGYPIDRMHNPIDRTGTQKRESLLF